MFGKLSVHDVCLTASHAENLGQQMGVAGSIWLSVVSVFMHFYKL